MFGPYNQSRHYAPTGPDGKAAARHSWKSFGFNPMKKIIGQILLVGIPFYMALADENALIGAWSGNDKASDAIYGTMKIGEKDISWGGTNPYNPYCKTTYSLVSSYSDKTYPGNELNTESPAGFVIYKIKIDPQKCTGRELYIQFAIPLDQKDYAEVVTYGADESQMGWHNFSKEKTTEETKK